MKKIFFLIALISGSIIHCMGQSGKSEPKKPNILVIVADDLGYADMSFLPYASKDISTPNIDRISEKSVFFNNAYATAPICSPSRAGLITGRYQQRWGNYWYNEGGLPASEKTLPQFLKEKGYYNVKIGKTHLNGGPVEHPMDHGFDDFLGFIDHTWDYLRLSEDDVAAYGKKNAKKAHIGPLINGRQKKSYKNSFTTDIFSEKAVEVITTRKANPWYIELEYNAVHHPTYISHPDYLKKYGIKQFPFWDPSVEPYEKWHKKWGSMREIDPDGRKRYQLQLEVMDNGIGKILDALETTDQVENTLIVFLSDNGGTIRTYSKNKPLNGFKYMFGEGGIRIPMMISYPNKIKNKTMNSALVSAMDVVPTLLSTVGVNLPKNLDGNNLWEIIEAPNKGHKTLFWSDGKEQWVVRKGDWKLVKNKGWKHPNYKLENGKAVSAEGYMYPSGMLLFNLKKDIGETKNVYEQYPKVVKSLTTAYQKWRKNMSAPRKSNGELK